MYKDTHFQLIMQIFTEINVIQKERLFVIITVDLFGGLSIFLYLYVLKITNIETSY